MDFNAFLDSIVKLSAILSALGAIIGLLFCCFQFVIRQREQDKEIAAIRKDIATSRKEQALVCYGVMACLKGLKEQGCDGPVTDALNKMEKYLNQAAHEEL